MSDFKTMLFKLESAHKSLQDFVQVQLVSDEPQGCAYLTRSQVMSVAWSMPHALYIKLQTDPLSILFQLSSFLLCHDESLVLWNLLLSFFKFLFLSFLRLLFRKFHIWYLSSVFISLQRNINRLLTWGYCFTQQYPLRFLGESFFPLLF